MNEEKVVRKSPKVYPNFGMWIDTRHAVPAMAYGVFLCVIDLHGSLAVQAVRWIPADDYSEGHWYDLQHNDTILDTYVIFWTSLPKVPDKIQELYPPL